MELPSLSAYGARLNLRAHIDRYYPVANLAIERGYARFDPVTAGIALPAT